MTTWQVVKMYETGGVAVVREFQTQRAAEAAEWAYDALTVAAMIFTGHWQPKYHYDVRRKPRPEPIGGLAGYCRHGEQMLNQCLACDVENLYQDVNALRKRQEEIEGIVQQMQAEQARRWWQRKETR